MVEKQFIETEAGLVARVTFRLPASLWATDLCLVGDFNDWDRSSHPLKQRRGGTWEITVELQPRYAYQFRYLLNGSEWINDEQADAYVYNRYGSDNFVVVTDPRYEPFRDEPGEKSKAKGKM